MNYFIANNDVKRGPFPIDQLLSQGLLPDTLVWREGMPDWQTADSVPELRALLGLNAAPPPGIPQPITYAPGPIYSQSDVNSKKIAAGICGILLGSLGIHKFILGMTTPGLIMLLVTICSCSFGALIMGPIGIIEGIIYLTKTDDEFYRTYLVDKKGWF